MLYKYSNYRAASKLKIRDRVAHGKRIWEVMEVTRIPNSEMVKIRLERGLGETLERKTFKVPRAHKFRVKA